MGKILFPNLSYLIVGICFEAHNEIGRFSKEKQYGNYIEKRIKEENLRYERELHIGDLGNIVDFLIEDKIILELKTKLRITKADYYQVQRYLRSTGIKLGLLVNFKSRHLNPKRIINSKM